MRTAENGLDVDICITNLTEKFLCFKQSILQNCKGVAMKYTVFTMFVSSALIMSCGTGKATSANKDVSSSSANSSVSVEWGAKISTAKVDSIYNGKSISANYSAISNGINGQIIGYDTTAFTDSMSVNENSQTTKVPISKTGEFIININSILEGSNDFVITPIVKSGYSSNPISIRFTMFISMV